MTLVGGQASYARTLSPSYLVGERCAFSAPLRPTCVHVILQWHFSTHIHTRAHTHTHTHAHTYTYAHTRTHITHAYTLTCTHTHIHARMHAHNQTDTSPLPEGSSPPLFLRSRTPPTLTVTVFSLLPPLWNATTFHRQAIGGVNLHENIMVRAHPCVYSRVMPARHSSPPGRPRAPLPYTYLCMLAASTDMSSISSVQMHIRETYIFV